MADLYPELDAYTEYPLDVGDGHVLHVEESGNPGGKPVVVLHGGPGGGISSTMRRYFDAKAYRAIIFDQRGAGRSTPHASVENNTTWDLVADVEKIRTHLGIEKWMVFGGSWGSTLALAYSQTHPERMTEMVLRGIFLIRPSELSWMYQDGASHIFPDVWERYLEPIPLDERDDLMAAYHRRLFGDDDAERQRCARAWTEWEHRISYLDVREPDESDEEVLAFARIENHYFVNGAWLRSPDQLLEDVDRIRHIPTVIVQGRYDVVCPTRSAWDLHRVWPEADLRISPHAGHSAFDTENAAALVDACDEFRTRSAEIRA